MGKCPECDYNGPYHKAEKWDIKEMLTNNALDLLVCPICKGKLVCDKEKQELICRFDKLAYPIAQNIPIMLAESARKFDV